MELLHKRLGHTSQSVIDRLVREQMVRGLEEGVKGEFGMCRGCTMGRSSDMKHPRKDPEYRATEQLEPATENPAPTGSGPGGSLGR